MKTEYEIWQDDIRHGRRPWVGLGSWRAVGLVLALLAAGVAFGALADRFLP